MSTMDPEYLQAAKVQDGFDAPLPPVSVLLELASLVCMLTYAVAKSYFVSLFSSAEQRFIAYPRAGTATMLRAFADRIKKE